MRAVLTILICALMLSGCIAQWPSHRSGPRWRGGSDVGPFYSGGSTPSGTDSGINPGTH